MSRFGTIAFGGAAMLAGLSLYLVSYNVADARDANETLRQQIAMLDAEIETMEAELGVLTSLTRLEAWNGAVWNMQAPKPGQIMAGTLQFAAYTDALSAEIEQPRLMRTNGQADKGGTVFAALAGAEPYSKSLAEADPPLKTAETFEVKRPQAPRAILAATAPLTGTVTPVRAATAQPKAEADPFADGFGAALGEETALFETASFSHVSLR